MKLFRKISILIPSRKRPHELLRLLESIYVSAESKNNFEVIVCCDHDDSQPLIACDMAMKFTGKRQDNIIKVVRRQSDNLSDDYYNFMARISSGDLLWPLNDDCEIKTLMWDLVILRIANKQKISYFYIDIQDSTRNFNNNGNFSCFPVISRDAFEAVGYLFHPHLRTWAADKYLYDLYAGLGLVIDKEQRIFVRHHRHEHGENFEKMKRVFEEDRDFRQSFSIQDEIKRMKDEGIYIK